jgi:transposase
MYSISTIGLDVAKSVFQAHGVDAAGQAIMRRQLKRRYVLAFFEKLPPCLVGIRSDQAARCILLANPEPSTPTFRARAMISRFQVEADIRWWVGPAGPVAIDP